MPGSIALPQARDLARMLLALFVLLGFLPLLLVAVGLTLQPGALLGQARPVRPAPALPPPPPRPAAASRSERQQLRSQLTAARHRLARMRQQREHWAFLVERMQAGGRRPHSRTLHNLDRRSAEVVRAWQELRELEQRSAARTG